MIPPSIFYNVDDDNDNKNTVPELERRKRQLENRIAQVEAEYRYDNKPIQHKVAKHIVESQSKTKVYDKYSDSMVKKSNRTPSNTQVKGILSKKQLFFLGIGITILLLFATGNLTQAGNELKLPQWKIPEPATGSTHIKKTIEDLVFWNQNKMGWVDKVKNYDDPAGSMVLLEQRKTVIDQMNCTELGDYVEKNTQATLRVYSAHLFIEKGCMKIFDISSIPDSAVITDSEQP